MTDAQVYAGAAAVGAMAGFRSMSAPAVLTNIVPANSLPLGPITLRALAVGEAIADKLPFMPDRTKAVPLIGRAVMGGLSGGAICASRKRSVAIGAAIGALAAIGTTFLAFKLRKLVSQKLPGTFAGLAEDAMVATAGYLVTQKLA